MISKSILFLTDHNTHSAQNSLYNLVVSACQHRGYDNVYVASRSEADNRAFFYDFTSTKIHCIQAEETFAFRESSFYSGRKDTYIDIKEVDFIWLRLPRPIPDGFFKFITQYHPADQMINNPNGIEITGSKAFLMEFKDYCAPIEIVHNKGELLEFAERYHTVVKPLEDYGGRGIFRIDEDAIISGNTKLDLNELDRLLPSQNYPVLAMKFLKNVVNGDKRIVVCGGKVITSSLRLPAAGSWLCNISQGGSSHIAKITKQERKIVEAVTVKLSGFGVHLFGIDTLEDDNGIRVLSEINTLSVGGITPSEQHTGEPLSKIVVDTIFHILSK